MNWCVCIAVRNVYADANNTNVIYKTGSLLEVFRSSLLWSTKTIWDGDYYILLIETKEQSNIKFNWKYFVIKGNQPVRATIVKETIDGLLISNGRSAYKACATIGLIDKRSLIKDSLRKHVNKNLCSSL